ncbi:MAG: hypothetical protein ACRDZY_19215, partial [Acidimicrobiales bacterium]
MGAPTEQQETDAGEHRAHDEWRDGRDRDWLESRVRRAFVLGWHVAQLYHSAIPRSPDAPQLPQPRLVGLSGLNPAMRYRLQLRMVDADIRAIALAGEVDAPVPSTLPVVRTLLTADHPSAQVSAGIYALHVALLEALTVTDFRLGKAYGLGRALAETALVPA